MRKGELQTTQDINQKFLIGELNGNEVWALEELNTNNSKKKHYNMGLRSPIPKEVKK